MSRKFTKRFLKPKLFDPKGHWMTGIVWPVTGSRGNSYSVTLHDKGFDCDCPGFGFHSYCKHSKAILAKVEEQMA